MNILQSIGPTELVIIAIVLLILFGGKKIPEFFKGLGDSVKEFKKSSKETEEKKTEE